MNFSDKIIKKYSDMADRRVAAACNINIIFMLIVAVLNILGIFIIRQSALLPSVAITIAIYMLPMIIHCILADYYISIQECHQVNTRKNIKNKM